MQDQVEERKKYVLWGLGLLALAALLVWGVLHLMKGGSGKPKKPPMVSLLPTTPPPPPPPPKEEKKPEPPKEQKVVQVDKQEPKPQQPPDQQLKMEGNAGDGPSPFANGKVTSDDLSHLGGKGGALDPFANYAAITKGELQRHLSRQGDLKRRRYRVQVDLWVSAEGLVKRAELVSSSGDGDIDQNIRQSLSGGLSFTEPPPANMPQPIHYLIITSGRS